MNVIKRNGDKEAVSFDKIKTRIEALCNLEPAIDNFYVSVDKVAQKTIAGLYDGVTTEQLDIEASRIAGSFMAEHYLYGMLAGRILVSNLKKKCPKTFSSAVERLYNHFNEKVQEKCPIVKKEFYEFVMKHSEVLNDAIDNSADYTYSLVSFKTLERSYLLRCADEVIETPQYLLMRVAVAVSKYDLKHALAMYDQLSRKLFTFATPVNFNSGTNMEQLASCFLLPVTEDSIEGIFDTVKSCAHISKSAGGIGISASNIRSKGSYIRSTNGTSDGIVPYLRILNETARAVNQGGKRKGSFAVYLEMWHPDIEDFLELRLSGGTEHTRTRDLFTALWMSDIFMERLSIVGSTWSLFDPDSCPGLNEVYGDEFKELYEKYESEGRAIKTIDPRGLMNKISHSIIETGTPYVVNKDRCNEMSNQKNIGIIKSSNLCCEIVEVSSPEETAVCNLASINFSNMCSPEIDGAVFVDYDLIVNTAYDVTCYLNSIIDITTYPLESARRSNMRHRPIGLGASGLQDLFFKLRLAFDSEGAAVVNRRVAEAVYFGAMNASVDLAEKDGPYSSYVGSPLSEGKFQFDLWDEADKLDDELKLDWAGLRERMNKFGARNSLVTCYMPCASSATIIGSIEAIEPITSNMYNRVLLSGNFTICNKYLVDDLTKLGIWSTELRDSIMANRGSVQGIESIPLELQHLYRTAYEISNRTIINRSRDRSIFVCQSQSLNLFLTEPTINIVNSMLHYSWKAGLKTMMYYLRTQTLGQAAQFSIAPTSKANEVEVQEEEECQVCSA